MSLVDQFPNEYARWEAAGGVENNFRAHLLGLGTFRPSADDWQFMFGQIIAILNQIKGMMDSGMQ